MSSPPPPPSSASAQEPPPPSPGGAQAPPPPDDGTGGRRLARVRDGKLLGGVAAGIAAHLGVDPVLVRIVFVILGFVPFPGFGVLVYLVLLVALPTVDVGPAGARSQDGQRGPAFYVGVGLVALGAIWVVGTASGGGELFPLVLIGLGVALWVDADRRGGSTRSTAPAVPAEPVTAPATSPPAGWAAASTDDDSAPPPPAPTSPETTVDTATRTWTPPPPAPPSRPDPRNRAWEQPPSAPRERSPLGRITLGLALLAAGVVWLLGEFGTLAPSGTDILATALVVLGAGLLVGAVFGRARWLSLVALPLAAVTLVSALADGLSLPIRGEYGDRTVTVTDPDDLATPFELGGGRLVVDLTELPADAGVLPEIRAHVTFGELVVRVPDGAGLTGTARVQGGELRVLDGDRGGLGISQSLDVPAREGRPTYDLDLQVGFGELEVREVRTDGPLTDDPFADATVETDR